MCLTRKARVLLGSCVLGSMMFGCQAIVPESTERLNNTPLIVDDAMQKRQWDQSTSYYANGDTVADGTGYMFETHETVPDGWRRVVEPAITTMNIALLPIGVFVNSPIKEQVYQGGIIPPTHHAMPPLP